MPPVSQRQRRLMYAAAAKKGGAGGVPQAVAKEFVDADKPGKLPESAPKQRTKRQKALYDKSGPK